MTFIFYSIFSEHAKFILTGNFNAGEPNPPTKVQEKMSYL